MVPANRDELLDPGWLRSALEDLGENDPIVRVEPTDTSKTRAEKLRFAVTVEGQDGRAVHFYCAKAFLDGAGSIIAEARFYRDLAPVSACAGPGCRTWRSTPTPTRDHRHGGHRRGWRAVHEPASDVLDRGNPGHVSRSSPVCTVRRGAWRR